jgi:ligand-binding SRPBCC domain-containing protein
MPEIVIEISVEAPRERVFDLARCIDLHQESMTGTNEKAVAGVTRGLIELGETVTWEATHLGIRQRLTSKITGFDRPRHFRDEMVSGVFKEFKHDHFFESNHDITVMRDIFSYESPFGILGRIADAVFLERYMTNLLTRRNHVIKHIAESNLWLKFLD